MKSRERLAEALENSNPKHPFQISRYFLFTKRVNAFSFITCPICFCVLVVCIFSVLSQLVNFEFSFYCKNGSCSMSNYHVGLARRFHYDDAG